MQLNAIDCESAVLECKQIAFSLYFKGMPSHSALGR